MRNVEGKYGTCYYYGKDEYVGRSIHNYGEFSLQECSKLLELAGEMGEANRLVLDIGANIGFISQMFAANNYEVIAFEPQPAIFELLCRNFPGGKHQCALGSQEDVDNSVAGMVKMPRVDYSRKGNFGGLSINTRSVLGSIEVPIKTLDSFEFQRVGLIKLDVEGFEEHVIMGGETTILRDKPILYVEDDRPSNTVALRHYIKSLGYTIEEHEPPLYNENNFFGLKKNIWDKNYVSKNIICRPC